MTLSISGGSNIYPSLAYAEENGLHHINCDHAEYEIPKDVNLSKEVTGSPVENPVIDGKMIKGVYSQDGLKRLEEINKTFKDLGYDPSPHSIEMAYKRTNNVNQLSDVLKNGEILRDKKGTKTYWKDRLTIHTDPATKSVITTAYRERNFNPYKKGWTKYE